MRQIKLSTTIFLGFSLVSSTILFLSVISIGLLMYWRIEHNVEQTLEIQSHDLIQNHFVSNSGELFFQTDNRGRSIAAYLRDIDVSALIINPSGRIIGTYGVYKNLENEDLLSPIIDKLLQIKSTQKNLYLDQNFPNRSTFDTYSRPIIIDGELVGILQVAKEAFVLASLYQSLVLVITFVLPISLLLNWAIGYFITSSSLRHLTLLTRFMKDSSPQQLPPPIKLESGISSEIASLSESFNQMISKITLDRHNQNSFLAQISHQIHTPIQHAISAIEDVLSSSQELAGDRQLLEDAKSKLLDTSSTIHSILQLSTTHIGLTPESSRDVYKLIGKIVVNYQKSITRDHLKVLVSKFKFSSQVPTAFLSIILDNLLSNAIKFNKIGGSIGFTFEPQSTSLIVTNTLGKPKNILASHHIGEALIKTICRLYHLNYHREQVKNQMVTKLTLV